MGAMLGPRCFRKREEEVRGTERHAEISVTQKDWRNNEGVLTQMDMMLRAEKEYETKKEGFHGPLRAPLNHTLDLETIALPRGVKG